MRLLTCKLRRRGEQDAFREVGEWGVPKFASSMEQEPVLSTQIVVGIWQCPRRGILLLESTITANVEQKVAACMWGPTDLSFDRPQKQHRQGQG